MDDCLQSIESHRTPPGPPGHFLHGNTIEYVTGRMAFLERMVRGYGDIVRYRLGCDVTYLINDPALCRAIFADWDHVDNAMTNGWMFLDQSYLAIHGHARTRPRSIVHGAICPRAIFARDEAMTACVARMAEGWREGDTIDVLGALMRVGVEMMSEALVGRPAHTWMAPIFGYLSDIQVLGGAYTESPEVAARLEMARRREVFETLEATVMELVAGLSEDPDENVPSLAALLKAKQQGELTLRGLIHEICVLFLSNGSSSLLAMSALYLLAHHAEVCAKLERELERELAGRMPVAADLGRLPYLDLVVKETLRLQPPVGLIPRLVVADFDCGPYRIAAGSQLHISPQLLQRHPRYWSEPERFWPERFDPAQTDHDPRAIRAAYMPFGAGIRRCIGDHFALIQVKLLLATLLPSVRLRAAPGTRLTCDISPMGASYPTAVALPMIVERRARRAGAVA